MKKKHSLLLLATGLLSVGVLAACGGGGNSNNPGDSSQTSGNPTSSSANPGNSSQAPSTFYFEISLSNHSKTINKGNTAKILISEKGGDDSVARSYSYSSSNPSVLDVDDEGNVTAMAKGSARLAVTEAVSGKSATLSITVTDADPAVGGFNYASASGAEAIAKRTEILGQLEKYAMDNHLTGITLFENGGLVKYSERVKLPTSDYITGYGFGLFSEGMLEGTLPFSTTTPTYLHTAMSSNPTSINARNDTGSQVSELEGHITQAYWGTRLNSTKDGYEWYPQLAKDTIKVNGVDVPFNRPVPVVVDKDEDDNITGETEIFSQQDPKASASGLYNTWRIYVKTANTDQRLKYRYAGEPWKDGSGNNLLLDNRPIQLKDYEFAYRYLLTGSHSLKRGAEAAGDQTYGIVGAQRYYNNTQNKLTTDEEARNTWNNMKADGKLGLKTGTDSVNGEYIQLTILNPIDSFTAMYTLSNNLYSPLPEEFLQAIGGNYNADNNDSPIRDGAIKYGGWNNDATAPSGHKNAICDYTISTGPVMLEKWEKNSYVLFKVNDSWKEQGRYKIPGIRMTYIDISNNSSNIFDHFSNGELDQAGIPTKYIAQEKNKPLVYETRGDATFKLNVNSCTQDMWDELNEKVWHNPDTQKYVCKPWMSNDNFLNGLFYSINRKQFAENRGSQPSINYFADSYLSDPENGLSYNDTEEHKKAVEAYQTYNQKQESTFGYDKDKAILSFKAAVEELVDAGQLKYGTEKNPNKINIHIRWMYQTDIKDYGEEIAKYFEDAFNDRRVSGGKIKLEVKQDAVTNWMEVYEVYLMKGKFDLGFGAISGNSYNPLNFLEVLKSDNSSSFTLNWGTDTSKINYKNPLIFEDKMWSFDALWAVADHGGVVNEGENAKLVEGCYIKATSNKFYEGTTFKVYTKFIDVDTAKLTIKNLQINVYGFGGFDFKTGDIDKEVISDEENPFYGQEMQVFTVTLSSEVAADINAQIRHTKKMDDENKPTLWNETPFTLENYGMYWSVELSYRLAIKAEGSEQFGAPTEAYVSAAPNADDWIVWDVQ